MRILIVGGGETIETVYYVARLFAERHYQVTIVTPLLAEAHMLSRRLSATILHGDGSDPRLLEEAGANRADVLLSLLPYDPDNLVTCQVGARLFGVPRTIALVNDPDNEPIFRQLGITEVFSATRILGRLIEGQTLQDEIAHLFPADEGRLYVAEVVLDDQTPTVGRPLQDIPLPPNSLVASVIRAGQVIVPDGSLRLQAADRLILITLPEHQEGAIRALTGQED